MSVSVKASLLILALVAISCIDGLEEEVPSPNSNYKTRANPSNSNSYSSLVTSDTDGLPAVPNDILNNEEYMALLHRVGNGGGGGGPQNLLEYQSRNASGRALDAHMEDEQLFFEEGFDPGYDMTLKMLKKAVIGM